MESTDDTSTTHPRRKSDVERDLGGTYAFIIGRVRRSLSTPVFYEKLRFEYGKFLVLWRVS